MNERRPRVGKNLHDWKKVRSGEYRADVSENQFTPEFIRFAEESRSRWDFLSYIKSRLPKFKTDATPVNKVK